MNGISRFVLNQSKLFHSKIVHSESIFSPEYKPKRELTGQYASDLIKEKILDDSPCMIARFGNVELSFLCSYKYITDNKRTNVLKRSYDYILGNIPQYWFEEHLFNMSTNAGFFPSTIENLEQFFDLMTKDMREVDILGSWLGGEEFFHNELSQSVKIRLRDIEPYYHHEPWSEKLKGKKVLVIHPFKKSIISQYKKRELLFQDQRILPSFNLSVFPAVQSIAGHEVPFNDWFEALEYMKIKIEQIDFDIAIFGCGAYGFPLAAHIKRMGKKAIHMGGATQILFGIKGRRWDSIPFFKSLMNDHWIRPDYSEIPNNSVRVEKGCYW